MTAEMVFTKIWITSLVGAVACGLLGFVAGWRWIWRLSRVAQLGALVAFAFASLFFYLFLLHTVVNWGLPSSGFGGIWIDPSVATRLTPVIGGVAGVLLGGAMRVARRRGTGAA